ncbi:hypothetical protein RI367_000286 [Sorochytrium milnesiophthora]
MIRGQAASKSRLTVRSNNGLNDASADEPLDEEMLFKMSKKIAQLTKVVFHLNAENEDNKFRERSIRDLYEEEIENVIRDARDKLQQSAEVSAGKTRSLEEQEAQHASELAGMRAAHDAAREQLVEQHEQELARTKQHLAQESQAALQQLQDKHDALKGEYASQIRDAERLSEQLAEVQRSLAASNDSFTAEQANATRLQTELNKLRKTQENDRDGWIEERGIQQRLDTQEQQLRKLFDEEKTRLLSDAAVDSNAQIRAETQRHADERSALEEQLKEARSALSASDKQCKELQGALAVQKQCVHLIGLL